MEVTARRHEASAGAVGTASPGIREPEAGIPSWGPRAVSDPDSVAQQGTRRATTISIATKVHHQIVAGEFRRPATGPRQVTRQWATTGRMLRIPGSHSISPRPREVQPAEVWETASGVERSLGCRRSTQCSARNLVELAPAPA